MMKEWQLIDSMRSWIPRKMQGEIGVGDDADLLTLSAKTRLVTCTDSIVESVDFKMTDKPESIGHKALAINLSDLAAMGSKPVGWLVSLTLPPHKVTTSWMKRFYGGMTALAAAYGMKFLGGDLSKGKDLAAHVTAIGTVAEGRLLTRSGAKDGDLVGVTGTFGGSLLKKHLTFKPCVEEGLFLTKSGAHAAIDVSDGLAQDLQHLLKQSKVGARIDLDLIPISNDVLVKSKGNPTLSLRSALTDGEDFELLFTASAQAAARISNGWPKAFPKRSLTWIGRIQPSSAGLSWIRNDRRVSLDSSWLRGYTHQL